MALTIRLACVDDLDDASNALALDADHSIAAWLNESSWKNSVVRRAKMASQLVGVEGGAIVESNDSEVEVLRVDDLVVDRSCRREGVATVVLSQFVKQVVATYRHAQLVRAVASPQLTGLLLKSGFRITRVVHFNPGDEACFEFELDVQAMRRLRVVQVDAFTSEIFQGNPAAVVLMPLDQYMHAHASEWMQNVAKEKNLAQTAFAARRGVEPSLHEDEESVVHYDLRWFSPVVEVPLCGHATLSTAFVLYEDGHVPLKSTIHFHTKSGILVCKREVVENKRWISKDFPLRGLVEASPALAQDTLARALGIDKSDIIAVKETRTAYVLLHISPAKFKTIRPNFDLMMGVDVIGIIVTALSPEGDADFQSRFFAPRIDVSEDPVTGSAHCVLAGYWSAVLNKAHLHAHQACPTRCGYMRRELPQDRIDRVVIKGEAVIACRGELNSDVKSWL